IGRHAFSVITARTHMLPTRWTVTQRTTTRQSAWHAPRITTRSSERPRPKRASIPALVHLEDPCSVKDGDGVLHTGFRAGRFARGPERPTRVDSGRPARA